MKPSKLFFYQSCKKVPPDSLSSYHFVIYRYICIYICRKNNTIGHFETKVQMSYIRRKLAFIFNFRVVNIAIVLSQPVSSWNQTPSYSDFENFDQNTNVLIL